jgi:prepilin-type N-terminal cleavage/methylation domain-containing protein
MALDRSSAAQRAFTLIELLIVILIIGLLVVISLPAFLGQAQKANDSAAQQALAVGYKEAKADAASTGGTFTSSSYTINQLTSDIRSSEPSLAVSSTPASTLANVTQQKTLYVVTAGTANSNLHLAYLTPDNRLWTLTVVGDGAPLYLLNENSSAEATAVLQNSPTSFFRFAETGPGVAADSSASGNNGTLSGGVYNQPGPMNGVNGNYAWGGSGGTLTLPPVLSFTSVTIEMWVKRTNNSTGFNFLHLYNPTSTQQLNLYYATDGTLGFYDSADGFTSNTSAGSAQISDGSWHMIDFVRDTSNNKVTIYVDGVQKYNSSIASGAPAYYFPYGTPNQGYQTLGGSTGSNDYFADFAIYPSALSQSAIAATYSAASTVATH